MMMGTLPSPDELCPDETAAALVGVACALTGGTAGGFDSVGTAVAAGLVATGGCAVSWGLETVAWGKPVATGGGTFVALGGGT